jgi:hypothetical protein
MLYRLIIPTGLTVCVSRQYITHDARETTPDASQKVTIYHSCRGFCLVLDHYLHVENIIQSVYLEDTVIP